jgi:hypothetical protein
MVTGQVVMPSGALYGITRCVSLAVVAKKFKFVAKCGPLDGVGQPVGCNQPRS